jgi:hypothetical protein
MAEKESAIGRSRISLALPPEQSGEPRPYLTYERLILPDEGSDPACRITRIEGRR